jgi:hypothetical protein
MHQFLGTKTTESNKSLKMMQTESINKKKKIDSLFVLINIDKKLNCRSA